MKNSKSLKTWLTNLNLKHPLLIAGPCSAETQAQVLQVAHQLKNTKTLILRAGIWKPRTRPGNFEGVGALGLKWLQQAKAETGLLTAVEVANTTHVNLALEHDVDVLWVGARTTVNPFMVQDIAEALKGTDKIVLVKNPINPDLALWLGAVERFYTMNIKNLGVIHRGFSTYEKTRYRNNPEWQIPIDLQQEFPDLPLLVDPSHISGKRDEIFNICQTALELNYDGFMIETHPNPDDAWSDAKQQITPKQLDSIFDNLKVRETTVASKVFNEAIIKLRDDIDTIDSDLIALLSERMQLVNKIGQLKKEHNVAILQQKRWQQILQQMLYLSKNKALSESFILRLYKAIHLESIAHQEQVINSKQ